MDASSIQISGSEIAGASPEALQGDGSFRLQFTRALILKTMTGSAEQTRWWQAGELLIGGVERVEGELPGVPAVCERGDIDDNQYTYRNMIPIPLKSRGQIRLELHLRDREEPLIVTGGTIELALRDTPKYIEHIRPATVRPEAIR
ncbi:hypothetical protein Thi970DRAFT_02337 [Thiorhodovibrio frisius]|uniref:Uncharacterized protein n=1 Tax=Thiorhodovibrio frisius TaxID=631362 RepID=H8YZG2_9GAMM|nr:hypothetical protein Thi970DRAFT_02337 [Thiorhodovibrio frisius]